MKHTVSGHRDSRISFDALTERLTTLFAEAGASEQVAAILARNLASCERDGTLSHGVFRADGIISSLKSGWADGLAVPTVERVGPSYLRVDAANGFAQPALEAARPQIDTAIAETGVAVVAIRQSHHFGALWPDLEPHAEAGRVALAMVASGFRAVRPRGTNAPVFGTNPFAFATPVAGGNPIVFDFATSSISHGDLQLHHRAGRSVPIGTGVDASGNDTEVPAEILDGGGILPFGGHKGALLSMMVEILAAGLTGGAFSFEMHAEVPADAQTYRTGQLYIFIDPTRGGNDVFTQRVADLVDMLRDNGMSRLPGDQRYAARSEAIAGGIPITPTIQGLFAR